MTTKQCFKCNKTLPLNDFYKHPKMADGRVNKCKECNKKDVRENRSLRIDYYREYDKARCNTPSRVLSHAKYAKTPEGIASSKKAKSKWKDNNVIKRAANILVSNYVRNGKLKKSKHCSTCGIESKKIHGHHCDYSKPLDVIWLCPKCHSEWHKHNKSINGD